MSGTLPISSTRIASEPSGNLFSIEDVYCHVDNYRIHYQVCGPLQAPPLVLIHGIGGNINWWRMNLPEFSRYFRTYALDLPGFGRSARLAGAYTIDRAAEFVLAWLKLLNFERVNIVAHSMGGQISARVAAQHPELINKLVLAAPSGLWVTPQQRVKWWMEMPKVSVPLSQTLTIAMGTMRTDLIALAQSLRAIISDGHAAVTLSRLQTPTLVVWGTSDGVLPPSLAPLTLKLIGNAPAQLSYVESGTHNLMYDQSIKFNHVVSNFLMENQ